MMFIQLGIIILMTCTPGLVDAQKKLVVFMSRHVKRAQGSPWRQFARQPFIKATQFLDNEFLPSQHHPKVFIPVNRKPKPMMTFNKHLPHGGDDFDQGFEDVNHIIVPHGKGISHAISFGKGYIPHEALMNHAGFSSDHSPDDSYNYNSITPVYINPPISQHVDSYYQSDEPEHDDIEDRKADGSDVEFKFHKAKGIPQEGPHSGKVMFHRKPLGGKAIVLKDTINFDEYNKKVAALTAIWPKSQHSPESVLSSANFGINPIQATGTIPPIPTLSQLQGHFHSPIHVTPSPEASNIIRSFNLHPHQGYAVTEDIQDIPHDFRTMPHQSNAIQLPFSNRLNIVPSYQNHFNSISPSPTAVPGYFALAGYPGTLPG